MAKTTNIADTVAFTLDANRGRVIELVKQHAAFAKAAAVLSAETGVAITEAELRPFWEQAHAAPVAVATNDIDLPPGKAAPVSP